MSMKWVRAALVAAHGQARGLELLRAYANAFPATYRADCGAATAVADIARIGQVRAQGHPILDLYRKRYADEPFVRVLDGPPNLRALRDTNECHVYVTVEERGRVMAFAAIDNIWKGASGQGVQNLNLMVGLDETAGLL